jgi:hypothetical protein
MVVFSCTGCGQSLQVSDASAGQSARCPRCGRITAVPVTPAVTSSSNASAPPQAVPVAAPLRVGTPEPTCASAVSPRARGSSDGETVTQAPQTPRSEPEVTAALPPRAIPVAAADPHHLAGLLAPPQ